jgi:glycine/sarcosine N-methyltransferase
MSESATFYATLAPHYDRLFPAEPSVISFLRACGAAPGATVMDVACGTGAYVEALANDGVRAYGVDLSPDMIRAAQRRARQARGSDSATEMQFAVADMTSLHETRTRADGQDSAWPETFDLLYCIGNSISHLPLRAQVEAALGSFAGILSPGAELVLQTVSMEEIPVGSHRLLPALTARGLRMERTYRRVDSETIAFDATLATPHGDAAITNRLLLIPETWMTDTLTHAGFDDVSVYGGYDRSPPRTDTWVRVFVARRTAVRAPQI